MLKLRKALELTLRAQSRIISVNGERLYSKDNENDKLKPESAAKHDEKQSSDGESAAARLNKLLASMQTEETPTQTEDVLLPKPGGQMRKKREAMKQEIANKDIFLAAKRVAELIDEGSSTKQSEMELLTKLLGNQNPVEQKQGSDAVVDNKSELSLHELMASMQIDHEKPQPDQIISRAEHVKRVMQQGNRPPFTNRTKTNTTHIGGSVNLFNSTPMGIFKNLNELKEEEDPLLTWRELQKEALKMKVTQSPANYFDKVARWTEAGRVWHFPINNEQGLEEESSVDFTEHVFLEQHLEPWCPTKGPIRHFMELVCVGLSKNHYITAREKRDHIFWYRDYFASKEQLLKELMKNTTTTASAQKELGQS